MVKYTYCEVRIPKSGKKLRSIKDVSFFFRTTKGLLYVYEVSTKVLILCCPASKGENFVEGFIERNMDRVERFMNGSEGS